MIHDEDEMGKVAICSQGSIGVIDEIIYMNPLMYRGTTLFGNKPWESTNPRIVNAEDSKKLILAAKWLADQEAN